MKIKKLKKQGLKYKIILENNDVIDTYDEVIIKNNILYKKEIDSKMLETILNENKYYEVYNALIKYIKNRLRSEYDIKKKLEKYEINDNKKEKILEELKNNNMINDRIFARSYIHDKLSFSQDGPNKIKQALLKEKINIEIIEEEFTSIDKDKVKEKLEKMILKKIQSNTKYTSSILKTKLLNYFINLGYEKENIIYYFDKNKTNNKINNKKIIQKEYDKLMNKYKNKYDEYQLKLIIKQKLYQKGFKIDEIEQILQK